MPFEGTLGEQPNKIIEAFQIIDVKKHEYLEKKRKEAEEKQKREARKR